MKENILVESNEINSSTNQLLDLVIESIQDIKGENIVQLDLTNVDDSASDYFVICEAESSTKIKAIADNIIKRCKSELGIYPNHTEGQQSATWVLVDFFDVVVHIFYPETRQYYDLEELWVDADKTTFENV